MKKLCFILIAAVCAFGNLQAQEALSIDKLQYWVDNDHDAAIESSTFEFDLDCSALSDGLHTLHYRVRDNAGQYSALHEHSFFKLTPQHIGTAVNALQYWVDDNLAETKETTTFEFNIDCSDLDDGSHTLHYRVRDNAGHYSALHEHAFFKLTPAFKATAVDSLQYWWDDMTTNILKMPYTGDEVILSVNAFSEGLHTLNYRVKDNAGKWSELKTHYFYRSGPADEAKIVSYTYWWNDMDSKAQTITLEEPLSTFVLDQDFQVPEDARTNFAGHYAATLSLTITDSRGRRVLTTATVNYPDNDCPITDIDADKYVSSSTVTISWEELSGDLMGDYNVYVSKDGGPFLLWLPDTKLTNATFKGELGSNYLFTVTGRDFAGNREKFDETKCVSVTFE